MKDVSLIVDELESVINDWINCDPDPDTKAQLQKLLKEHKEQALALFAQRLEFGTAGLRGEVGLGPSHINRFVIQQTAFGIGQYLKQFFPEDLDAGVIVGFDGRLQSPQYAEDVADVLTAQGLTVFLLDAPAPTPLIPFGVLHNQHLAGLMITASHNPATDNGLKLYWQHGAQIEPEHIAKIQAQIVSNPTQVVPRNTPEIAKKQGLLKHLGVDFLDHYTQHLLTMPHLQHKKLYPKLKIAYTALHGVGAQITNNLFEILGIEWFPVREQCTPNGNFPEMPYPNPEDPSTLEKVIETAKANECHLAIAHDPDADRLCVIAPETPHNWSVLSGNQVGCLIADHILQQPRKTKQVLIGNTIVSSSMLAKLAKAYDAKYYQTLTGFKWLAKNAMDQQTKKIQFLFAYEEALGYMFNNHIWDKDGLSSLLVFLDFYACLLQKNQTVWQKLEALYRQYGLFVHKQVTLKLNPESKQLIQNLRETVNYDLADYSLTSFQDMMNSKTMCSNMLVFHYEDVRVILRPSGTEPKIKFYYEWHQKVHSKIHFQSAQHLAQKKLDQFIEQHQNFLQQFKT
jgi:phosphomannomutase